MRVLFVTNYFPPYELGGQGRSCQQVVTGLQQRGHSTCVLTSMHGTDNQIVEAGGVRRALYQEMDLTPLWHSLVFFTRRGARARRNLRELERILEDFEPDIIFVWGMWNLNQAIPALAEARLPGRVAYRFAEYWPLLTNQHTLYWQRPGRSLPGRLVKQGLLAPLAFAMLSREDQRRERLEFRHAICVSKATRDVLVEAGVPVEHASIIYTGLDTDDPSYQSLNIQRDSKDGTLRLLTAGRLEKEKGLETVIQAVADLRDKGVDQITLSIAGVGNPRYADHLKQMLVSLKLEQRVMLLGRVPYAEMPALMAQNDILVVPSLWPEPFARVVLEGMLAGMSVIASDVGGTTEIVEDGSNGLLFSAGDSSELAAKIQRLAEEPDLRRRLGENGRQTVVRDFTFAKMLDSYEMFLEAAIKSGQPAYQ
jgi:glycosyltransferase involved in cell wall biosynthesis